MLVAIQRADSTRTCVCLYCVYNIEVSNQSARQWYGTCCMRRERSNAERRIFLAFVVLLLATLKVISEQVPTCDRAQVMFAFVLLPHWETRMSATWHDIPHYPVTEPTSPCPIPIMLSTWLGSDKYQYDNSLAWLDHGFKPTISLTSDPCSTGSGHHAQLESTISWWWWVGLLAQSGSLFDMFYSRQALCELTQYLSVMHTYNCSYWYQYGLLCNRPPPFFYSTILPFQLIIISLFYIANTRLFGVIDTYLIFYI